MNLLENEKVREFFGCEANEPSGHIHPHWSCPGTVAERVLAAMSADMKMYEKGLYTCDDGKTWKEGDITGVPFVGEWHPTWLRLPDQFQPKPQRPPSGCEQASVFISDKGVKCNGCGEMYQHPKPPAEKCELGRCNGACASEWRCAVCRNRQSHCSCYEFKPSPKGEQTPPEQKEKCCVVCLESEHRPDCVCHEPKSSIERIPHNNRRSGCCGVNEDHFTRRNYAS